MRTIGRGRLRLVPRRRSGAVLPRVMRLGGVPRDQGAMPVRLRHDGAQAAGQQYGKEASQHAARARAGGEDGSHGQQTRLSGREFQPAQKYVARPNWKPARRAGSLP